jgi:hypothetical protein
MLRTIDPAIAKAPITKQIKGTFLNLKIIAIKNADKTIEMAIIQNKRPGRKRLVLQDERTFSKNKQDLFYCILQGGFGLTSI